MLFFVSLFSLLFSFSLFLSLRLSSVFHADRKTTQRRQTKGYDTNQFRKKHWSFNKFLRLWSESNLIDLLHRFNLCFAWNSVSKQGASYFAFRCGLFKCIRNRISILNFEGESPIAWPFLGILRDSSTKILFHVSFKFSVLFFLIYFRYYWSDQIIVGSVDRTAYHLS